jgi:hypothetical protein
MGMFSKSVKLVAALALLSVPFVWGQGDGAVKKILDKAQQMKTEGARHTAAVEAVQGDDAKKPAAKGDAKSDSKSAPQGATGKTGATGAKGAARKGAAPVDKGDPFALPIKPMAVSQAPQNLPPGQAGLLVSQAEVQGLLKMAGGNRVIIRGPGNPPRVYFLKVGDKIYNAHITRITDDAVYFEETAVDPFGKPIKREVAKRMPSEGKQ